MRNVLVCALFSLFLCVSGCAPYRLGSTLDPSLTAVYVPTVRSNVNEPGIESAVTSALISEIQRDGTMRITPESLATTKLEVTIVDYSQSAIRYNSDDNDRAEEYRMVLRAQVVFSRISGEKAGSVILRCVLEGEETFLKGMDTVSAKQRWLPEACDDLAEQIVDACISIW